MAAIVWRGTRAELMRSLHLLPALLAGRRADPLGLAKGLQLRLGVTVLSKVQVAFVVKSRGGTGSDGIKWAPLAKRTLTKKRTGGTGKADALRDTGALLRSLTPGVDDRPSGAPGQLFELVAGGVIVGSKLPYAGFHQDGTEHVPARPIVPPDGRIPDAWAPDLEAAGVRGLIRAVELMALAGGIG